MLSFLINPQPSSFGWKSSGFPVRKRPQTNIVLRVILTYSCQVDVLCTTVTVSCQSTTAFRHSAKLTATKNTSVNCESARACNLFPASACIYSSSVSALLTSLVLFDDLLKFLEAVSTQISSIYFAELDGNMDTSPVIKEQWHLSMQCCKTCSSTSNKLLIKARNMLALLTHSK